MHVIPPLREFGLTVPVSWESKYVLGLGSTFQLGGLFVGPFRKNWLFFMVVGV